MSSICIYYTENLGEKYFRFEIKNDRNISIAKNLTGKDDNVYEQIMLIEDYKKVFIGYDEEKKINTSGFAVLINTVDRKYYYLGSEFYEFEAKEDIIKFRLIVDKDGNVKPFALDRLENIYLMKEKVSFLSEKEFFEKPIEILDQEITKKRKKVYNDPYEFYQETRLPKNKLTFMRAKRINK